MLFFIDKCRDIDIPVLVMNPNYNNDPETNVTIPHNQSPEDHCLWVWEKYVKNSGFD